MVEWWRSKTPIVRYLRFASWLDLLGVVLAIWISILKISKLFLNCWHSILLHRIAFRETENEFCEKEMILWHRIDFCDTKLTFYNKNITVPIGAP